ncbi:MAG: hypothetical protein Unbinned3325contig1000_26 [Prokaryotic dsDNA virus sp.]|jgi:hypothetical protein|nr:MAG: hypothetical protein Unbinned3325contig1000_26 [Prokaryotic dsDNA virus sp.]|tara:strand:- start:9675 stop:9824 length:150 start_codon:yes stop_codon:yes gene_type:complete
MIDAIHHFITHFICCYYPKIIMFSSLGVLATAGFYKQQIICFIKKGDKK